MRHWISAIPIRKPRGCVLIPHVRRWMIARCAKRSITTIDRDALQGDIFSKDVIPPLSWWCRASMATIGSEVWPYDPGKSTAVAGGSRGRQVPVDA